jgi:type I restriction enzyme M protein
VETNAGRATKRRNTSSAKEEPMEKQLWKAADKLRKNIDAAEYKHIVLGLVFLKYISDAFVELHTKLLAEKDSGADPEDKDEYKAENVFFVPPGARWSFLQSHAKQPTIGKTVDEAMDAIERENDSLKGVLPKVYARQNLDPTSLGGLIDLIGNIALGDAKSRSADVLGHVFEYFLGEFALAEGKKGGQFYTPRSVVELLVQMLEPYKGRVFDPCCGSGGMFVQSEKFVTEHQGKVNDISIYGQESNQTTWRLAKMNLAIRGLDSSQVKWNSEGSFLNDAHKDLKADYIIANPPFNVSDWSGDLLRTDGRWKYGVPPAGNANFAWMQHFIHHLSPSGQAGVVLSKGALTSKSSGEGEIRKAMVEAGLIDCIVNLPAKLFLNTQIPASLWFFSRKPSPQPSPSGRGSQTQNSGANPRGGGGARDYRGGFHYAGLVERARELRRKQTPAEEAMWETLRNRQFMDLKFRRQHQFGNYIVDFYCHEAKLVVELDGAPHSEEARMKHDKKRDAYLTTMGLTVLRFPNSQWAEDPNGVLDKIAEAAHFSSLRSTAQIAGSHSTSPRGGGREGEILFIDARHLGHLVNRRTREFSAEDIRLIADTYHNWRNPKGTYADVPGFCCAAPLSRVKELDYVLTPGRYVGLAEEEDDFNFAERFAALQAEFAAQLKEEAELNSTILKNLKSVKVDG